jgi:hypothetical protein
MRTLKRSQIREISKAIAAEKARREFEAGNVDELIAKYHGNISDNS